jgi:hypothetical protein
MGTCEPADTSGCAGLEERPRAAGGSRQGRFGRARESGRAGRWLVVFGSSSTSTCTVHLLPVGVGFDEHEHERGT